MPSYRHHDYGNLYIKFEIEFPTPEWAQFAGEGALNTLRQILPPATPLDVPPNAHVDDSVLANVDPMQQQRAEMDGAMDIEDDEDGAPGVQCASQ